MKISKGFYTIRNGKKAEVIGRNVGADVFIFEGFILSGKKYIIQTAWDEEGKNIANNKFDLIMEA